MPRTNSVAQANRAWFRDACRALLTLDPVLTSRREPGLLGSGALVVEEDDDGNTAQHSVSFAEHPLRVGREPSALERLWYGRALVRMFFQPGEQSRRILRRLARQVLSRFFRNDKDDRRDAIVDAAIDPFVARSHPGRYFYPKGVTLDLVIDEVRIYLIQALKNNAGEWLQTEALAGGAIIESASITSSRDEDALIEHMDRRQNDEYADGPVDTPDVDRDDVGEWVPAASTARRWKQRGWSKTSVPTAEEVSVRAKLRRAPPEAYRSVSDLAKQFERAPSTVRSAIRRAEAAGVRFERVDGQRVINDELVSEIRSHMRPARAAYARKRRPMYPRDAIVFGSDVAPAKKDKA
jgi:hypothetical protein